MFTFSSPAVTLKPPVLLSVPVILRIPLPAFVRADEPLIVPDSVTVLVLVSKVLAAVVLKVCMWVFQ